MNIIFIYVMKFHNILILIFDYIFIFLINIIFKKFKYYNWRKMDIEEENDKNNEKSSIFFKF